MKNLLVLTLLCFGFVMPVQAADVDQRFHVLLNQEQAKGLDIQAATELALPILWQRVVPAKDLEAALGFPAAKSLLLQFKIVKHGMQLVFNPAQVGSFLAKRGVNMILQQPHWNLNVMASGFSASDEVLAQDLLNSGHAMADEYGVQLSPRGKKLDVIFSPVMDAYGEVFVHVDLQGDFTSALLHQTDQPSKGYAVYQLQDFLKQILLEIRDLYALGTLRFKTSSSEIILRIESDYSLASQVMLEQALAKHPAVVSMMPTMLQKMRRQYRLELRNEDDTWLQTWFEGYGLRAVKQPEGSLEDWLAE